MLLGFRLSIGLQRCACTSLQNMLLSMVKSLNRYDQVENLVMGELPCIIHLGGPKVLTSTKAPCKRKADGNKDKT